MVIGVICLCVVVLVVVLLVRGANLKPSRPAGQPIDAGGWKAGDAEVGRFQELLRVRTVSRDDPADVDRTAFERWVPTLKRLYPKTFEACELTMIDEFGILLRWPGKDPSLDPVIAMAHHDVVPVNESEWKHDPFGAEIIDGEIWARGTLDTKCIVAGVFEALEYHISRGLVPPRDVYYFSSNQEEVAGATAPHAVQWLRDHDIRPYLVMDEGGAIAADAPLGIDVPVAMVGVSEKGHLDISVTVEGSAGHASTPSATDAPVELCAAARAICDNPGAPHYGDVTDFMLKELASHTSLGLKTVFANLWLFRPVVTKIMAASPETAAMLHSTYALTQLKGSNQHNVLPRTAWADINIRTAPFETNAQAIARAQASASAAVKAPAKVVVTNDDSIDSTEPAPISPWQGDPAFDYIHRCVAGVYPEAGFSPYIQNSCTDSRNFNDICDRVYRFAGFIYTGEERTLLHAPNERISLEHFKRGLEFYIAFFGNLDKLQ